MFRAIRPVAMAGLHLICVIALGSLLASEPALAHSNLKSTNPASGSVVTTSPFVIELNFGEEVRLTSVVIVKPDGTQLPLTFTPEGSAVAFAVKRPELASGKNEILWKALSKDGHVVSGTFVLTLKPASTGH